jgi:hypothetical protein
MINHHDMIHKALVNPTKPYKSSNLSYNVAWRNTWAKDEQWFEFIGEFMSYRTPVAVLKRNKLTDKRELHITTQQHSPTTDRHLSRLRWQAGILETPLAIYDVPWITTKAEGRFDPAYLQNTINNTIGTLNELLGKTRHYKTYVFQIRQCIDRLKRAMYLMTDTVPEEIYDEYFTTEQKDKLQEVINLRVLLGSLLHHSNEDGRVLKQALLGLRELNK